MKGRKTFSQRRKNMNEGVERWERVKEKQRQGLVVHTIISGFNPKCKWKPNKYMYI